MARITKADLKRAFDEGVDAGVNQFLNGVDFDNPYEDRHDWNMPHFWDISGVVGCPPNCPAKGTEDEL